MRTVWRSARKIRIHCPIHQDTLAELFKGNISALESDANAAKILAIIRAPNPLGDFELYQGVFEVSLGIEGFTSTARAQPTAGQPGADFLSPTAIITTYVDAGADRQSVLAALEALVNAHPWETPVIEFMEQTIQLSTRTEG